MDEHLKRISVNLYLASEYNKKLISYNANMETAKIQYGNLFDLWDDIARIFKLHDTKIGEKMKAKFDEAEYLRGKNVLSKNLIWILTDILSKIRDAIQICGLGVQLKLQTTQLKKLEAAMGLSKNG